VAKQVVIIEMAFDATDGNTNSIIKTVVFFVANRVLIEKRLKNNSILTVSLYTHEKKTLDL
jgi:hypothetical protein